ncbi:MAG: B12-binding domain-containing radical SAM protein [Candidatus Muiribacteriota bacterium]
MKKVILVYIPEVSKDDLEEHIIPNGLLYLYNSALKNKINTDLVFLHPESINDFLDSLNGDEVVGFSVNSSNYNISFESAHLIKKYFPDITLVAGGPAISLQNKKTLRNNLLFNTFFCNESDYSFIKEYFNGFENKIVSAERINNLDELGFPAESALIYSNIVTSRGCPGKCIYCCSPGLYGQKIKLRSAFSIEQEINLLFKKGVDYFVFSDDTFTLSRERILKICNFLKNKKLVFDARSRTDYMDEIIIKKLAEAGCVSISFGIESASHKILNLLQKEINLDHAREVIALCKKYGIYVNLFFIVGNPEENEFDVEKSALFIKEVKPDLITVYGLHYFRGSELYKKFPPQYQGKLFYSNEQDVLKKKKYLLGVFSENRNKPDLNILKQIDDKFKIKFKYYDKAGDLAENWTQKRKYYKKALKYYEAPEIMYKLGMTGDKKYLKKAADKFYFQMTNDLRKTEQFLKNCETAFEAINSN